MRFSNMINRLTTRTNPTLPRLVTVPRTNIQANIVLGGVRHAPQSAPTAFISKRPNYVHWARHAEPQLYRALQGHGTISARLDSILPLRVQLTAFERRYATQGLHTLDANDRALFGMACLAGATILAGGLATGVAPASALGGIAVFTFGGATVLSQREMTQRSQDLLTISRHLDGAEQSLQNYLQAHPSERAAFDRFAQSFQAQ